MLLCEQINHIYKIIKMQLYFKLYTYSLIQSFQLSLEKLFSQRQLKTNWLILYKCSSQSFIKFPTSVSYRNIAKSNAIQKSDSLKTIRNYQCPIIQCYNQSIIKLVDSENENQISYKLENVALLKQKYKTILLKVYHAQSQL